MMWFSQCFMTMDGDNTRASASRAGICSEETGRHFAGQPCDDTGHHEDEGKCVCMPSHFSHGGLCATHGLQSTRSLCPWDSPGKKLEWVAVPSFRGSSPPKDQTQVSYTSCIDRWVLYHWCHLGSLVMKPQWWWFSCSVVSDSFDPLDCSLSGSSVPGILQARTLEWVAVPSSRRSSQLRDRTRVSCIAGRFFMD